MGCISSRSKDRETVSENKRDSEDRDSRSGSPLAENDISIGVDTDSFTNLKDNDISKITDIVSAKNRHRFAVEYLEINPNEYHTIEAEAQYVHHDTVFECIRRWKNRTEAEENNARDELIRILRKIRQEHGWFSGHEMAFITDVSGIKIPESRLQKIQDWTKDSLKRRLNKSLSHDWIPEKSAHKFPLRQYYVQLEWQKKLQTAMGSRSITLTSLHDLIKQLGLVKGDNKSQDAAATYGPVCASSVIVEGEGGIGKTSSLGMVGLDWAEDKWPELKQFQFFFLVLLRYVDGNEPLEEIIMKQHGRLETENVSPSEVRAILHGTTNSNILLMFDGYDEYSEGTNEDIDKILLNGRDNCMIIVSSRSGDFLHTIKTSMDEEVRISGFSKQNIIKCAEQYLESDQSDQFLSQAKQAGIHSERETDSSIYDGLLHVPIILLMACAVFIENKSLPSSKTDIFTKVVYMSISRTTLKTMGKTAQEVENLRELMVKLGRLAWESLNKQTKQLLMYKKDVIAESPEILKLGLLFGEDIDATTTDLPEVLSFQHKLIQEYLAAVYITENITACVSPAFLEEALPTWEKIKDHREVLHFACSMLGKDRAIPLINHLGKILRKHSLTKLDEGRIIPDDLIKDLSLLSSFERASSVTSINPFITFYPGCGKPLAEVLANTKVVVITQDIHKNDTHQLRTSPANVFLLLDQVEHNQDIDRLLMALGPIHDNIVAGWLNKSSRPIITHTKHFSGLKLLSIQQAEQYDLNEVASCISSLGVNPPLTLIEIFGSRMRLTMPQSLMAALSGCTHLRNLAINEVSLQGNLSILMTSPPPRLRELALWNCNLDAEDVGHIVQAFREDKLTCLEELDIHHNPIGEAGVRSLLQAISTTSHALKELDLRGTGVEEGGWTHLSEQFRNEWKEKLTNIEVDLY